MWYVSGGPGEQDASGVAAGERQRWQHNRSAPTPLAEPAQGLWGDGTSAGRVGKAVAWLPDGPWHRFKRCLNFHSQSSNSWNRDGWWNLRNTFHCSLPLQLAEACGGATSAATACNQIQREG